MGREGGGGRQSETLEAGGASLQGQDVRNCDENLAVRGVVDAVIPLSKKVSDRLREKTGEKKVATNSVWIAHMLAPGTSLLNLITSTRRQ